MHIKALFISTDDYIEFHLEDNYKEYGGTDYYEILEEGKLYDKYEELKEEFFDYNKQLLFEKREKLRQKLKDLKIETVDDVLNVKDPDISYELYWYFQLKIGAPSWDGTFYNLSEGNYFPTKEEAKEYYYAIVDLHM
jgi:hypothetical protein